MKLQLRSGERKTNVRRNKQSGKSEIAQTAIQTDNQTDKTPLPGPISPHQQPHRRKLNQPAPGPTRVVHKTIQNRGSPQAKSQPTAQPDHGGPNIVEEEKDDREETPAQVAGAK